MVVCSRLGAFEFEASVGCETRLSEIANYEENLSAVG